MKVKCARCLLQFEIPDDRLPVGKEIAFPCPKCKETIEIDLRSEQEKDGLISEDEQKDYIKGEALKKRILRHIKDLPPMPRTVMKAREIIADPNSSFKDLADLFETDQAMAAKILKLANSPYYGMGGKVSSIQHASVVLGYRTLGELITMGGTSNLLGKNLEGYGLDAGDLWKHSIAVAFGSKLIANIKQPEIANDAFTAGLIHDAGKLILDKFIAERWELFERFMSDGEHTFLEAEKEILELDHSEAAFEVCKAWNVPKHITIAIKYHHHPSGSNDSLLAYIVHMADAVSMMAGLGMGIDGVLYKMDENAMGFLDLNEQDIEKIMTQVITAAKELSGHDIS